jgi:aminoglycoside 3-N-acetyltransferase
MSLGSVWVLTVSDMAADYGSGRFEPMKTTQAHTGADHNVEMERDPEHLTADLRRLGVADGDVLMVHASLRAIGPVVGGARAVLDAIEAAIGARGTILMTLGACDDWAWINERPAHERPALVRAAEPFDCKVTPADPDVGVLAEVFRTRPGTLVSDHPEARFGASGPLAATLVDDVPWDDYYGPGSPLERLVRAEGRVLRLGADLDTVTLLHYAEYAAPFAGKRRVSRYPVVAGRHGPEQRVLTCLDDSDGIAEYPGEDYFAVILRDYLATGRAAQGLVGRATSELIDGADVVEFAAAWMVEHLAGRGSTPPRGRG